MIIYKHEYYLRDHKLRTYKVNVEEKPKTYIVIKKNQGVWETRVFKKDIDKLDGFSIKKMFSLSADPTEFLKSLIDMVDTRIMSIKRDLEMTVNEKTNLLKLLDEQEKGANE